MENHWLKWAKRLHALASTGLHYTESEYDRERYREIAGIALSMMAKIGQTPPDALPPLSTNRVLEADIHAAFSHHANPALPLVFD